MCNGVTTNSSGSVLYDLERITTMQIDVQRIGTNYNESVAIRLSWRRYDCLEHFKTFVSAPRTLAIPATSNEFLPQQNEQQRTTTSSAIFADSLWFAAKSWQCDLDLNKKTRPYRRRMVGLLLCFFSHRIFIMIYQVNDTEIHYDSMHIIIFHFIKINSASVDFATR